MNKPTGKLAMAHQTIANMEVKIAVLVAASQASLELVGIVTAGRDALAAKLSGVMDELGDFCAALDGMLLADLGADEISEDLEKRMSHYKNDAAKFLAAHDAEAIETALDACRHTLNYGQVPVSEIVDYIDQLRAKAGA